MRREFFGLLLGVAMAAGVCGLASSDANAACRDDLVASQQKLSQSRTALANAAALAETQQCPAYRRHYAAMVEVKRVFAQCDAGAQKAEHAAALDSSIAAFRKKMPAGCQP